MYETKAEDLKKNLQKMLSATEVTHAYLEQYAVHLFIVVAKKTTHYLYIKDDITKDIVNQLNQFAIKPLNAANDEKRYYLDKDGIQIVDEEFDTFIRTRQHSR